MLLNAAQLAEGLVNETPTRNNIWPTYASWIRSCYYLNAATGIETSY